MSKTPRLILSFTLPFFIALVFMLSVFTYSMGNIISRDNKPIDQENSEDIAYVLGTTSDSEFAVESTSSAAEVLDNYKSVVTNADGTRIEVSKKVKGSKVSVKIVQYDMFGAKVSEKSYEEDITEEGKRSNEFKVTKQNSFVTREQLRTKLQGIGYTYNNSKVTIQKSDDGDVYKVPAYKTQKLFGLIKINLPADLYVSSTDGTTRVSRSFFTSFLDFLSK